VPSGRPFHVKRPWLLLVTLLLALAIVPFPQAPASASCAGPYLKTGQRLVLERGATTTVEGRAFVDGCQDSEGCTVGLGCDNCEYDEPPPTPMRDVELRLRQGDRIWKLATADAGSAADNHLGWVTWTFDLPAGVKPGPARLLPEQTEAVRIRVR